MSRTTDDRDSAELGDRLDRNETEAERLDRNWNEILQELRVTQTGTQILTGFLLTLAFQPRFQDLTTEQVIVYLVLVGLAVLATALGLAPVSLHRALFRQRAKKEIVDLADRIMQCTLVCVGLLVTGVAMFVFDVVLDLTAGVIAGIAAGVVILGLWVVLPITNHPRRRRDR
ncbi:MAG TPA: DUF6328 family protein [Naasia sp.]|jgi:hypothetical protein